VAKATAELHESGVKCYFLHGNRDFLLGEKYAASAKLKLLPETVVVDLYGIPTLLLHGDTLCTDDTEYQALRQQLRDPAWQAGVLAMTIEQRLQMAQEARVASMQHTGSAAEEIMDVNAAAVASAFREQGVSRMIHGHTHRPAFHQVDLDATSAERIVLADWYDSGSYLEVSTDGARSLNVQ
jgi:UDP-2,3-diacylglucosamine hydrolase